MPTKRKSRRTRSPHPGVVLLKRERAKGTVHLARWTDPDTGKRTETSLTKLGLTTRETRRAWAVSKAKQLARLRADREAGIERRRSVALDDAVAGYLERVSQRLRPSTVQSYRLAAQRFLEWARAKRIGETEDLNRARLHRFADFVAAAPKTAAAKGARRGKRASTGEKRSAYSVNRELRETKTMLAAWIDRGLAPQLRHDDLRALKLRRVELDLPEFLRPEDVQTLLRAALRHDEARYVATRLEHAGKRERGTTRRHRPIAPFVAVVLLTGMRFGEAMELRWSWVRLDDDEWADGSIRLPASLVKTKRGRLIDLGVSPLLHNLLRGLAMRRGRSERVFPHLTRDRADAARARLLADYGAPSFTWQTLRRTCATYLNCAPIFDQGVAAFRAAKQLGHSPMVAERRYAGLVKVDPSAVTLELAMGVEREAQLVVRAATAGRPVVGALSALPGPRGAAG